LEESPWGPGTPHGDRPVRVACYACQARDRLLRPLIWSKLSVLVLDFTAVCSRLNLFDTDTRTRIYNVLRSTWQEARDHEPAIQPPRTFSFVRPTSYFHPAKTMYLADIARSFAIQYHYAVT
jgi:hypothetical protein